MVRLKKMEVRCVGCGLPVPGGTAGCQALFDGLIAREISDYRYGRYHRLAVDCYCLQHPYRYCVSAKSLMAHLGGLCCAFHYGANPDVYKALQRSLNGLPSLQKPPLPASRGTLTIANVLHAYDPESYTRELHRWAQSVWDAYAGLQAFARSWIERILAAPNGRRKKR